MYPLGDQFAKSKAISFERVRVKFHRELINSPRFVACLTGGFNGGGLGEENRPFGRKADELKADGGRLV